MGRKGRSYKFTEKSHSKKAIAALTVSSVLLVLYLVFVYLAYKGDGGLSTYYGSVGVMAMLLSVIALIVSVTTFFEEDSFQSVPRLAFLTSLLSSAGWVGTYVIGFLCG